MSKHLTGLALLLALTLLLSTSHAQDDEADATTTPTATADSQATLDAAVADLFTQTASAPTDLPPTLTVQAAFDAALTATHESRLVDDVDYAATVTAATEESPPFSATPAPPTPIIARELVPVNADNANQMRELHRFDGHQGAVHAVAFHADNVTIASAGEDGLVRLWNTLTGEQIAIFEHAGTVFTVAFDPDNAEVMAAGTRDGSVYIWDIESRETITVMQGHTAAVRSLVFAADGSMLASGGDDTSVILYNGDLYDIITNYEGHSGSVRGLTFSPQRFDDSGDFRLVSVSGDRTVIIRIASTGDMLYALSEDTGGLLSAAYNPGGSLVAVGSSDHNIYLWSEQTASLVATLVEHDDWVFSVDFRPETRDTDRGDILASGSNDGALRLWDMVNGDPLVALAGHDGAVLSVAFSPDALRLVSAGVDGSVRLWGISGE